jgi:serine/threonine-protein kinase HipA
VLVTAIDGDWAYPHGRAHSTHILKPQVPARPTRIFDEYYSHVLTRHVGLSHYKSEIRAAGKTTYLAIERFDRDVSDGVVTVRHQEDLAQALELDWRNTDVKFQDPDWPTNPHRATARRIAELLGSIPRSTVAVEQWLRQLTFHVAIGNNDAHAKNVALMHSEGGTELSQVYDALPNLFQEGLVTTALALAVDGIFDHCRMSVGRILNEVISWNVMSHARAEVLVSETLARIADAIAANEPPKGSSPGMGERLEWNVSRLLAGTEISQPKR